MPETTFGTIEIDELSLDALIRRNFSGRFVPGDFTVSSANNSHYVTACDASRGYAFFYGPEFERDGNQARQNFISVGQKPDEIVIRRQRGYMGISWRRPN